MKTSLSNRNIQMPQIPPSYLPLDPAQAVIIPRIYRDLPCYILPEGIGDIAWVYTKLVNLHDRMVFALACDCSAGTTSGPSLRSVSFLKLLPNVAYSTVALCTGWQLLSVVGSSSGMNGIPQETPAYFMVNQWLERGKLLDDFLPQIKTTRHFELLRPDWADQDAKEFLETEEPFFAVYTSSESYYLTKEMGYQNLPPPSWLKLCDWLLYKMKGHRIVLVGSPWDLGMLLQVRDGLRALGHRKRVLLAHDKDIAVSLEILRRSKFLVGAVSGLTILAEYQYVPTVHLYPVFLIDYYSVMGTWESPEMVKEKKSLSLKIQDPLEKTMEQMERSFCPLSV